MQSPDARPAAADAWQSGPRSANGLPPTPPLSSVVSPGSSYGFGGHMESPSLSQAGADDDADAAKRRTNPLIDLIESEKRYVEELGMVIRVRPSGPPCFVRSLAWRPTARRPTTSVRARERLTAPPPSLARLAFPPFLQKVAGAWSRQNFPPPLLDLMFRSIEGVYKINRGFGSVRRAQLLVACGSRQPAAGRPWLTIALPSAFSLARNSRKLVRARRPRRPWATCSCAGSVLIAPLAPAHVPFAHER